MQRRHPARLAETHSGHRIRAEPEVATKPLPNKAVGRRNSMGSESFRLIAEIGAALAGFAAIARIIRSDPVDRDAAFDIAAYGAMASLFALAAILLPTVLGECTAWL